MVKIIIDSTADLKPGLKENFIVVPLTVHFGEEEYLDGVTIDHKMFYDKLIESDVLPTTSQGTPHAFSKVFTEATADGSECVVITISSTLSGTCQSAQIAAQDFSGKVFVVDSETVTVGTGILAEYALELVKQGFSAKDIAEKLNECKKNIRIIALLDTLEYLQKGGRISKTTAFAGGLLNIKPVVCVKDGVIEMLGKARGSKQGNNLLVKEIEAAGGVDFSKPVTLGYSGLSDHMLLKYIEDSEHLWKDHLSELGYTTIGSVVGTHVGPGAIAVAFFKK